MSSMKGLSLVLATSFMLSFSPGSSFASGGVSVDPDSHTAVSYTHLTLPTNREV